MKPVNLQGDFQLAWNLQDATEVAKVAIDLDNPKLQQYLSECAAIKEEQRQRAQKHSARQYVSVSCKDPLTFSSLRDRRVGWYSKPGDYFIDYQKRNFWASVFSLGYTKLHSA